MRKRRTIADRYERSAMRLLMKHKIAWTEQPIRRYAMAYPIERRIVAPLPRTAQQFHVFAHEIAHVILKHTSWPTTPLGQAEEVAAGHWALARLRRIRGYIPRTVMCETYRKLGRSLFDLACRGEISLPAAERLLRNPNS